MAIDKDKKEKDNASMNKDDEYIKEHPDYYGEDE